MLHTGTIFATDNGQFITLSVYLLYTQDDAREATGRAGSSAAADTYPNLKCVASAVPKM